MRALSRRAIALTLAAALGTASPALAATDYTQGVTPVNATQARVWFTPTIPAALVDVHYLVPGVPQQNFRMARNGATRAVGRDFCAAFNRGVALNPNTADWKNAAKYYLTNPRNDYAAYFHSISIDKRSYAFAYDDVNDQSSVKILGNSNPPSRLTLTIGW